MNFKVKCVGYNSYEKLFTIGKIYNVKNGNIVSDGGYKYNAWSSDGDAFENLYRWFKFCYEFELVKTPPEIHITVKGNETIAVYKNGDEHKKAVAKCSPEDEFDFGIGAKLALERLGVLPTDPVVKDEPMRLTDRGIDYGVVGTPTEYKDSLGNDLYVGDVVHLLSLSQLESYGLECVVETKSKRFIMGISADCEKGEINKDWRIVKMIDHSEMHRGKKVGVIEYT